MLSISILSDNTEPIEISLEIINFATFLPFFETVSLCFARQS